MSWGWSSARGRVLSGGWLGVLTYVVPPDLADEAVGDGLAWEMRLRSLPARLVLYFTLGLCLFGGSPYREVARQITAGLQERLAEAGWAVPAATALSAARARLGEEPLRSVFRRLCSGLSPGTAPWSHVGGLLAVAWDGTTLAVRDTPANAVLGRHGATGKSAEAGPRLRLVVLLACGTRGLLDAAVGPSAGKGSGEQALAARLLGSLRPGMLLLADRNFWGFRLWAATAATGAHLLWRVKQGTHLPLLRELPDGSWLARADDPYQKQLRSTRERKRKSRPARRDRRPEAARLPGAVTVRVIEYTLAVTADDGTTRTERYRLVTTLLDHRAYPAAQLAAAYSRRWAIETGYRECKDYLRGSGRLLRGGTPALARQEAWALLAVYQAVRTLIARAAARSGTDPGRISFTAALHAARRTVNSPRGQLAATLDAAETEILSCLVPERTGRVYPRAVRKPVSAYPSRHNSMTPISQHATHTTTITPPSPPARTPPDQAKQPATATPRPP